MIDERVVPPPAGRATRQKSFSRFAPLIGWLAFIFFASTAEFSAANTGSWLEPLVRWFAPQISREGIALIHLLVRKAGHFSEYAILALLAARAFMTSPNERLRTSWFVGALLLVSLYAFSDEFHQSFVPSRTASVYDSLIDIAGGMTVLVLVHLRRKPRKTVREAA